MCICCRPFWRFCGRHVVESASGIGSSSLPLHLKASTHCGVYVDDFVFLTTEPCVVLSIFIVGKI